MSRSDNVDPGEEVLFDPAIHTVDWAPSPDDPGALPCRALFSCRLSLNLPTLFSLSLSLFLYAHAHTLHTNTLCTYTYLHSGEERERESCMLVTRETTSHATHTLGCMLLTHEGGMVRRQKQSDPCYMLHATDTQTRLDDTHTL